MLGFGTFFSIKKTLFISGVASESVAEFETMLNQAYEKNALLELEVDEKERMQVKLQRLMDEARGELIQFGINVRIYRKTTNFDNPML